MENDVATRARDAAYTAVGFGVLAVQRLQVRRRDLTKDVVERRLPLPSRLVVKGARRAARRVQSSVLN